MREIIVLCSKNKKSRDEYALHLKFGDRSQDTIIISSSRIREELGEDLKNPYDVYREMNRRTVISLLKGKRVVYNSSNIKEKDRKDIREKLMGSLIGFKEEYKIEYHFLITGNKEEDSLLMEEYQSNKNNRVIVLEEVFKNG